MSNQEKELPEFNKKKAMSKYASAWGSFSNHALQNNFSDIDERLRDLEHKVNPTAKKVLSNRSQQMLILHHLGVLDKLNDFNISGKKKAKLLSILLNASHDNIEGDLSIIANPKSKIHTSDNYKIVTAAFKAGGLSKLADETESIFDKLINLENK